MSEITVEVVYALLSHQEVIKINVEADSTIQDVIEQSELMTKYPEITLSKDNPEHNKVGIYNQIKSLEEIVKNGDRIEIYRHLMIDPKEVRRKRAQQQKDEGVI